MSKMYVLTLNANGEKTRLHFGCLAGNKDFLFKLMVFATNRNEFVSFELADVSKLKTRADEEMERVFDYLEMVHGWNG